MIRFFPPYTPELNPTEQQCGDTKQATANTSYEKVEEMKKDIRKMSKNGEIKVTKMSDYLRV